MGTQKIEYWLKGQETQNFGDFLSEVFIERLFQSPRIEADRYRVIGSVIAEGIIAADRKFIRGKASPESQQHGSIVFWGCGARDDRPIPQEHMAHCRFFGVRGPLTRDLLGLPVGTPIGDPALLLPLIHKGRRRSWRAPSICVPHFHEPLDDEELLQLTGADEIIRSKIPDDVRAVYEIIDRISSAKFVLSGSLHAAIVACAYNVPFAFLDSGYVDCPFKWRDFAASISTPTVFVRSIYEGKKIYGSIKRWIRKPPALPLLEVCPFNVERPSEMR